MNCVRCGYKLLDGAPICAGCGLPTSQPPINYSPMGPQQSQPGSGFNGPAAGPPYQPPQQPYYGPPPMPYTPPRKSNAGLWGCLGVGALLLLIFLCVAASMWQRSVVQSDNNASATATASDATSTAYTDATSTAYAISLTPTPYPAYSESNPPSQMDFSGTAQSILTNAQLASEVRSDNQPARISSHFKPYDKVYLTYNLTAGHTGYAMAKWYAQGNDGQESKIQALDGREGSGYFSATYYDPAQGAVELYWCGKADCSDRQLAWVRPFTIDK